ncbi:MAG: hypothetical protein IKF90_13670, partial [Parasporobacterium sp.]|nr:hypothetical protein [Parasporobacterium sp.]
FSIGDVGGTTFSVRGFQFQLLTICKQFTGTFFIQALFQNNSISTGMTGIRLLGQYADNINDRKVPLLSICVPSCADMIIDW